MGFKKLVPRNNFGVSKNFDKHAARELGLVMDNDYSTYQQENALYKNYKRKFDKGKFNYQKAETGVLNLLVTPQARKYQNEWRVKIGTAERKAVARGKTREMFKSLLGTKGYERE